MTKWRRLLNETTWFLYTYSTYEFVKAMKHFRNEYKAWKYVRAKVAHLIPYYIREGQEQ